MFAAWCSRRRASSASSLAIDEQGHGPSRGLERAEPLRSGGDGYSELAERHRLAGAALGDELADLAEGEDSPRLGVASVPEEPISAPGRFRIPLGVSRRNAAHASGLRSRRPLHRLARRRQAGCHVGATGWPRVIGALATDDARSVDVPRRAPRHPFSARGRTHAPFGPGRHSSRRAPAGVGSTRGRLRPCESFPIHCHVAALGVICSSVIIAAPFAAGRSASSPRRAPAPSLARAAGSCGAGPRSLHGGAIARCGPRREAVARRRGPARSPAPSRRLRGKPRWHGRCFRRPPPASSPGTFPPARVAVRTSPGALRSVVTSGAAGSGAGNSASGPIGVEERTREARRARTELLRARPGGGARKLSLRAPLRSRGAEVRNCTLCDRQPRRASMPLVLTGARPCRDRMTPTRQRLHLRSAAPGRVRDTRRSSAKVHEQWARASSPWSKSSTTHEARSRLARRAVSTLERHRAGPAGYVVLSRVGGEGGLGSLDDGSVGDASPSAGRYRLGQQVIMDLPLLAGVGQDDEGRSVHERLRRTSSSHEARGASQRSLADAPRLRGDCPRGAPRRGGREP